MLCEHGFLSAAGCSDELPLSLKMPPLDPAAIAKEAISRYDTNADGKLDAKELEASPALVPCCARSRTTMPATPIRSRPRTSPPASRPGSKAAACCSAARTRVTLDGKRLAGAVVTWEPEPYLGPAYHPSSGTTNKNGYAYLSPALEGFQGIFPGLYTVRISKKVQGKETIPACYNEKSTLGREVAVDVPDAEHLFNFDLKSK